MSGEIDVDLRKKIVLIGVGQINTAVSQLDKVTQENASGSEESATAGQPAGTGSEASLSPDQRKTSGF